MKRVLVVPWSTAPTKSGIGAPFRSAGWTVVRMVVGSGVGSPGVGAPVGAPVRPVAGGPLGAPVRPVAGGPVRAAVGPAVSVVAGTAVAGTAVGRTVPGQAARAAVRGPVGTPVRAGVGLSGGCVARPAVVAGVGPVLGAVARILGRGTEVGAVVGARAGSTVGARAGPAVGAPVGVIVGPTVRTRAGSTIGARAGAAVGAVVGARARSTVGARVGPVVGTAVRPGVGAGVHVDVRALRRTLLPVDRDVGVGVLALAAEGLLLPRRHVDVGVLPDRLGLVRAAGRNVLVLVLALPAGMARALVLGPAGVVVARHGSDEGVREEAADDAADDRADHRDPGVAPVAVALAPDRQDGVRHPRAEVAGRVDGVAGGAAERGADADHEDQHERADDLGDQVPGGVADRRAGGEDGELGRRVLGLVEVLPVRQPGQHRAEEGAEELRGEIHQCRAEVLVHARRVRVDVAVDQQAERDGGVEVRAGAEGDVD